MISDTIALALIAAAVTLGTLALQGHYHMVTVASLANGGNGQVEPPLGPSGK